MSCKFTVLFSILIGLQSAAFGCDCGQQGNLKDAQRQNYEESDFIFIGRVNEIKSDKNFEFEVIETFKGEEQQFIQIAHTNSCSLLAADNNVYWLIYMNKPKDSGKGTISICSLSRSFKNPFPMHIDDINPPQPALQLEEYKPLESELVIANASVRYLEILKKEIEQLRAWTDRN